LSLNFNSANKTYTITGGTQVGTNQFHSFQDFSVPTANTAHFDNALTTTNVIGRVTGKNISDIDGTLRTNGTTNLYLINPNGIIFGANAKLDVAGSFSASTANSIKFSDGSEFSATNPQAPPLLQVNMPLGLQYGNSNPAPVSNAGNLTVGSNLTLSGSSVTSTGTLNALQGNLQLDAVAGNVNVSQFQAGTATLTATQGVLLENGKFQTTGDLRLLAKDTVILQDSAAIPLNLQVGGDLLVQGDRAVTVNALANPDSSLWVGKNVLLRSDNPIAIDAHWNGGGNLRVEKLDGSLGDLYSPNDPIFQFGDDVWVNNYTTNSLQILAGGSVTFFGTLSITGSSLVFNNSTVILSNGSSLDISGTTKPVVDIRSGVRLAGFFPSPPITTTGVPSSADINIRNINFNNTLAGSNGLVFLTNQFDPNPLLFGNIVVRAINTANDMIAGSVVIDSKPTFRS
jgi:filamentous hemagglutinin family protein